MVKNKKEYYAIYTPNDLYLRGFESLKEVGEFLGYKRPEYLSRTILNFKDKVKIETVFENILYTSTLLWISPNEYKVYKFSEEEVE